MAQEELITMQYLFSELGITATTVQYTVTKALKIIIIFKIILELISLTRRRRS